MVPSSTEERLRAGVVKCKKGDFVIACLPAACLPACLPATAQACLGLLFEMSERHRGLWSMEMVLIDHQLKTLVYSLRL